MEEVPNEGQSETSQTGEPENLRKERIVKQVEIEMRRRKRLLRFYASLLVVGLLLGVAALLLATPASVKLTDEQLKPVLVEINNKANNAAEDANKRVSVTGVNAQAQVTEAARQASENISTLASEEVNKQIQPPLLRLESQAANMQAAAARLNGFEPSRIDQSIIAANKLNKGLEKITRLTVEQDKEKDKLENLQNTLKAQMGWLDPDAAGRPGIFRGYEAQLKTMSDTISSLQGKLAALEAQLDSLKSRTSTVDSHRLSYSVKEGSKAQIYDLDLKVKVGTQKNGVIDRIEISSTMNRRINGKSSFEFRNLDMGQSMRFEDGEYAYVLTPIYIQRRALKKDFIGFAIQRNRLMKPSEPNPHPSPTP